MKRREFIKFAGMGVVTFAIPTLAIEKKTVQKPNLLFVFADQYRRHAMGFMKEDPVITPNFDRFAKESMVFDNAISSRPVCSPFRAMLQTGRYPLSTKIVTNCQAGLNLQLSETETCIGDVLKANGYQTGYIGKWHLEEPSLNRSKKPVDGAKHTWDGWTPSGPRRHGYDFWYAYNTFDDHFHPHYWKDGPEKIEINQWSVDHETDVAMNFIKNRKKDKPFSLFISWNPPHGPYIAPENFKNFYHDKDLPVRSNVKKANKKYESSRIGYYGAVSSCDHNFDRLLKVLEEENISDNTIVIFTADHGEMLGSHGKYGKTVWYEESIGIPFLIRWPKKIKASREEMLFGSYNFMPTILGLMGLPIPKTVEGKDLSSVMLAKKSACKPTSVFLANYLCPGWLAPDCQQKASKWVLEGVERKNKGIDWRTVGYRGLRTERYTYVVNRGSNGLTLERYLYDNEKDRYQMNPIKVAKVEENEVMVKLDKELQEWLNEMNDPFPLI